MKTTLLGQFLPDNNQVFYNLFNEASANSTAMAKLLYEAVSSSSTQEQKNQFNQISRLKNKAHELKRQVYAVSGKAFVSPFERNDMYSLVSAIYNVADYIDNAARRINLYAIDVITPPLKELCNLIVEASVALEGCIRAMNNLRQNDIIEAGCNQVKLLEYHADQVYDKALAALNHDETNIFQVLKYSEIFSALEKTTDKCEHATYVIESILIKNS
ncbi:DUF47 family protein [Mucilaginibacter robiniae]|uniref:DUF47 family protein n=1 Tax=Mucilaginibacter robiniae TaxID=2728022 RepID=A0A7L5E2V7_9SPHI|nr:DUF47 family protein [Mucilaginibacter robiniae]QJD95123.1 DUF47 family protein [Mucilaginibacter robiniae]